MIIFKWSFFILNTISYFLMLMNTWQFHLLNWQGVGPVWTILVSFVYTGLLDRVFLQSHKLNLTCCLKSSLSLVFCSLFFCMVDQTQMYPSSISPLGLLQGSYLIFIVWTPFIYRGLGFLKNHRRGINIFL